MANPIERKDSNVQGKIPLKTDILLGEVAHETVDGRTYIKKNDGDDLITEIASLHNNHSYEKAQILNVNTLIASGSLLIDLSVGNDIHITHSGGASIDTPTNIKVGQSGTIYIKQALADATIAWGSSWQLMDSKSVHLVTEDLDNLKIDYVNVYEYTVYSSTIITVNHVGYFDDGGAAVIYAGETDATYDLGANVIDNGQMLQGDYKITIYDPETPIVLSDGYVTMTTSNVGVDHGSIKFDSSALSIGDEVQIDFHLTELEASIYGISFNIGYGIAPGWRTAYDGNYSFTGTITHDPITYPLNFIIASNDTGSYELRNVTVRVIRGGKSERKLVNSGFTNEVDNGVMHTSNFVELVDPAQYIPIPMMEFSKTAQASVVDPLGDGSCIATYDQRSRKEMTTAVYMDINENIDYLKFGKGDLGFGAHYDEDASHQQITTATATKSITLFYNKNSYTKGGVQVNQYLMDCRHVTSEYVIIRNDGSVNVSGVTLKTADGSSLVSPVNLNELTFLYIEFTTPTSDFIFGDYSSLVHNNYGFNGMMTQMRFHNKALSDVEIATFASEVIAGDMLAGTIQYNASDKEFQANPTKWSTCERVFNSFSNFATLDVVPDIEDAFYLTKNQDALVDLWFGGNHPLTFTKDNIVNFYPAYEGVINYSGSHYERTLSDVSYPYTELDISGWTYSAANGLVVTDNLDGTYDFFIPADAVSPYLNITSTALASNYLGERFHRHELIAWFTTLSGDSLTSTWLTCRGDWTAGSLRENPVALGTGAIAFNTRRVRYEIGFDSTKWYSGSDMYSDYISVMKIRFSTPTVDTTIRFEPEKLTGQKGGVHIENSHANCFENSPHTHGPSVVKTDCNIMGSIKDLQSGPAHMYDTRYGMKPYVDTGIIPNWQEDFSWSFVSYSGTAADHTLIDEIFIGTMDGHGGNMRAMRYRSGAAYYCYMPTATKTVYHPAEAYVYFAMTWNKTTKLCKLYHNNTLIGEYGTGADPYQPVKPIYIGGASHESGVNYGNSSYPIGRVKIEPNVYWEQSDIDADYAEAKLLQPELP